MSSPEHRVPVDNGTYTFLLLEGHYKIFVLRHGHAWHEQSEAHHAIRALMSELDAARVVVAAVRRLAESWRTGAQARLERVLQHHDRLVADRSPPSPWTGVRGEAELQALLRESSTDLATDAKATTASPPLDDHAQFLIDEHERELRDVRRDSSLVTAEETRAMIREVAEQVADSQGLDEIDRTPRDNVLRFIGDVADRVAAKIASRADEDRVRDPRAPEDLVEWQFLGGEWETVTVLRTYPDGDCEICLADSERRSPSWRVPASSLRRRSEVTGSAPPRAHEGGRSPGSGDLSDDERELLTLLRGDPSLLQALLGAARCGPRSPVGVLHKLLEVRMFALGRGYRGAADRVGRLIDAARPRDVRQGGRERRTVLLVSDSPSHPTEAIYVTGTRADILQAVRRMATRTRGCVSIAEAVWQYHRVGCEDRSSDERLEWAPWGGGAEAEELRRGVERVVADEDLTSGQVRQALRDLLDQVDAHDSLAYLQGQEPASPGIEDPACSACGAPHARLVCQFEDRHGRRCDRPLCRRCVGRVVTDRDLCPDHRRQLQRSVMDSTEDRDLGVGDPYPSRPDPVTGRALQALLRDLEVSDRAGAFDREVVLRLPVLGTTYLGGLRAVRVDTECDEDPSVVLDGTEGVASDHESRPIDARVAELRWRTRSLLAELLQEDVDGGELLKETWEACVDDAERDVVRSEICAILTWLRDARNAP